MDITFLVQSLLGLISLLAVLMFFLLYTFKEKKKPQPQEQTPESPKIDTSLPALRKIIRNPEATSEELADALQLVLKYHGTIHPKLGMRPHPDFDSYGDILFQIGRHKHINKDILLRFNKELEKNNPSYAKEIDDALMRGLNSRGI